MDFLQYSISIAYLSIFHSRGESEEKKIKIPPSINYVVENYLTSGGRSTEIGIAIAKKDMKSANRLPVVVFIHGGAGEMGIKIKVFGNALDMLVMGLLV